jgi:hypothetical protein
MTRIRSGLVLVVLCVPLLLGGGPRARSISISLPGDGTTVVRLPDGVVILDTVAVKKRVENLKDVTYSAAISIDNERLVFGGTIDSGHLKDGELRFKSTAELTSAFTTAGTGCKVTLKAGEVTVRVEDNELTTFDGNIDFEAEIPIGDKEVTVEGSVDGEYDEGEFSFDGTFLLADPLELLVGPALLTLGSAFALTAAPDRGCYLMPEVEDEVLVTFEAGDTRTPIAIGSLWSGRRLTSCSSDGADYSGNMALVNTVEIVAGDVAIRLLKGEVIAVDIEDSELIDLRLDGVRFQAATIVNGERLVVEGKIKEGSYHSDSRSIIIKAKELEDLGEKEIKINITPPEDPPSIVR